MTVMSVQVGPVVDHGDCFELVLDWHDERADRWGVYLREDGGLATHYADYSCPAAAMCAACHLSSLHGVPVERVYLIWTR